MQKLDVRKLGIAFGVAWALLTFLGGLVAAWFDWGVQLINLLGSIYLGFGPTFTGSLIGAVWGFVNGLIWGMIIAWVYNNIS